jgi:hypothetical protein
MREDSPKNFQPMACPASRLLSSSRDSGSGVGLHVQEGRGFHLNLQLSESGCRFFLLKLHSKHSILVLAIGCAFICSVRNLQRSLHAAKHALVVVSQRCRHVVGASSLGSDVEVPVRKRNVQIGHVDTGQINTNMEVVGSFDDIRGQYRLQIRDVVTRTLHQGRRRVPDQPTQVTT